MPRDATTSPLYCLRDYEEARRLNRIVEGEEPLTNKARVAALTGASHRLDRDAREWAMQCFADGAPVRLWTERTGTVMIDSLSEWDSVHATAVAALKVDA